MWFVRVSKDGVILETCYENEVGKFKIEIWERSIAKSFRQCFFTIIKRSTWVQSFAAKQTVNVCVTILFLVYFLQISFLEECC